MLMPNSWQLYCLGFTVLHDTIRACLRSRTNLVTRLTVQFCSWLRKSGHFLPIFSPINCKLERSIYSPSLLAVSSGTTLISSQRWHSSGHAQLQTSMMVIMEENGVKSMGPKATAGDGKICYDECSSHPGLATHNTKQDNLDKLDGLLPEIKGRILEHLNHEDVFKLKFLSKSWKAFIESEEFIQGLSLKAKPVVTAFSFSIDKGVWQWAAFDPNWNSKKGNWRKLPPLTFLPPNCDPDPDLFKQFLFCANDGLVCMNFSKSPHEERLIVFNPLTEQWKELPPMLHRRNPDLMHMYVDQSSKLYRILAAGSSASGDESLSRFTELYDSRSGQWERVGDLPGPAFALNEYQSGVFQDGNIFCIGFVELGDQTVKGILGYNVEEGIWSTNWPAEALPNSTILQLVQNNGELFLFSERDNGPLVEHWVDRVEWTQSEGDYEEKTFTFKLVNVLKKIKSGGRSLEVYPEFSLVPFSESQLCIYNTVDHSGEVFDIGDAEKCETLPALPEGFGGELGLFSLNPVSFATETRFSSKV